MDISTQEAMQMQCHLYQLGLRPIFVHDSVADDTLFTLWKMKFLLHVRCRVCRVQNIRRSMRVERRQKRNLMILLMYQLFFDLECHLPPRWMWWVHPMNQPRSLPGKGEFHVQIQELKLYPDRLQSRTQTGGKASAQKRDSLCFSGKKSLLFSSRKWNNKKMSGSIDIRQ